MNNLLIVIFLIPFSASAQFTLPAIANQDQDFVCQTVTGGSQDYGRFTFCWDDIEVPAGDGTSYGNTFADQSLQLAIEESPGMVTTVGNRLRFLVDPRNPSPSFPRVDDFNYRAEIIQNPWLANLPNGTEEWIAYSITFSDDYVPDLSQNWAMMQHKSTDWYSPNYDPVTNPNERRTTPVLSLHLTPQGYIGSSGGEISILNFARKPLPSYADQTDRADRILTGIFPQAGQTFNIVHHIIHGDNATGLWQVWINGDLLHNKQSATLYPEVPVSGNFKVGAYMPLWRNESAVITSESNGVNKMDIYMGTLRIIRKRSTDPDYMTDELKFMNEIFLQ